MEEFSEKQTYADHCNSGQLRANSWHTLGTLWEFAGNSLGKLREQQLEIHSGKSQTNASSAIRQENTQPTSATLETDNTNTHNTNTNNTNTTNTHNMAIFLYKFPRRKNSFHYQTLAFSSVEIFLFPIWEQ